MRKVLANPAEVIANGAPRLIHNDQELAAYTDALFELTALDNPSCSQVEAIELLTLLIDNYERRRYPIPAADAISVVRFLIEHQGLAQRDLIPQFGSESAVSMFLAGQRKLTLDQVRKLSARFKLPADVFIAEAWDVELSNKRTLQRTLGGICGSLSGKVNPLGSDMVPNVGSAHPENHIFGDVRRVVADALQVAGDH
jgi:HTH-type transcriptional regulator / antitoxin HigA